MISFLKRAADYFGRNEIVSRGFRYSYRDFYQRVCRLGNALARLGLEPGDRVATLAWNTHRHLELYFAIPGMGLVLNALNLRLPKAHLSYIISHAEDKALFVDEDLLPLVELIADELGAVKAFVVMGERRARPQSRLAPLYLYEELITESSPEASFPELSEDAPFSLCYTSATTGDPKGVMFTHRQAALHTLAISSAFGLSEADTIMHIVPMFHAHSWGIPFIATMLACKQVLPGSFDPGILLESIERERVTVALAVPSVFLMLMAHPNFERCDLSSLRLIGGGGSAWPRSLYERWKARLPNVELVQAYGMTEAFPVLTVSRPKSHMRDWPFEKQLDVICKQGLPVPGVELKVVDEKGREVPRDGKSMGEVIARAPWIADGYYKEPEKTAETWRGGWYHTGDVATVDEEGYITIVDRTKDLIKSGGEWISSVEVENALMGHPDVLEAAVVAARHDKWLERPVACVVLKPQAEGRVTEAELLDFLRARLAKWWVPDRVVFIDEMPKTGTGKFDKKLLRAKFWHILSTTDQATQG